ncbi:MAG: hypothetical protein EHM28_14400 [Spirochaetaceae bacterium]|nr:MAG: hypothetical protein EHM28_14400 [Spirochaetaceae bacterium]
MRSFLSIFLFLISLTAISAENFYYREITGDRITPLFNKITTNGQNRTIESCSWYGTSTYYTDLDFNMNAWHFIHETNGSDFWAHRNGTKIVLTGTFQNKPVNREYTVSNGRWYQCLDLSLSKYAASSDKEHIFWVIRPTDLEYLEMIATKDGEEFVKVNGDTVWAVRLKVTVTGISGAFWSSSYWYRKSDMNYVRYEAYHGGLGTPLTVFELLREES